MRARIVALCLGAFAFAACSSNDETPASPDGEADVGAVETGGDTSTPDATSDATVDTSDATDDVGSEILPDAAEDLWPADTAGMTLDHYEIRVDPSKPGTTALQVAPVFVPTPDAGAETGGIGTPIGGNVTAHSILTGEGTWDATTKRFVGTLRLVNTGTTNWDEPVLVTTSFSTLAKKIVFQEAPGQAGTLAGSGIVGSSWAFADIPKTSDTKPNAWQKIAIVDEDAKSAIVRVEVHAFEVASVVSADEDDDSWNEESGEPAGSDCNDADKTKFPGGGACTCLASCGGAPSAPSCGVGQCCTDSCSGASCARTCSTGCTCNESLAASGANTMGCAAGSVCHVSATDLATASISSCGAGSRCDLACSHSATGTTDVSCSVDACAGGNCAIALNGVAKLAEIKSCTAGATCTIACSPGSDCRVTCDDASACRISGCDGAGTSCNLTCSKTTDCGHGVRVCGGPEAC